MSKQAEAKNVEFKEITVRFSVNGWCRQTIELSPDCPYSAKEIEAGLNSSDGVSIWTTIQEGGDLVLLDNGNETVIGKVTNVDMECEYEDFELDD